MTDILKNLLGIFKSDEALLSSARIHKLAIYYPLSRSAIKQHEIYVHKYPPSNRHLPTSLEGLMRWIFANPVRVNVFQYYTVIPIGDFKLDTENGELIMGEGYDTIRVKIPFTVKIHKIYIVPDVNVLLDKEIFNY